MPRPTPSLAPVYLAVFVDLLGFGLVLPALPYYAETLGAGGVELGWIVAAFSLAQLASSPVLGRLGDRVGRKPVLMMSLLGTAASFAWMAHADTLGVLIATRVLAGGFGGSIGTAQAAIADVTPPEQRAKRMGLVGASIGLGFVVGPSLGALLSPWGFEAAAWVACGLAVVNAVLLAARFQETRPEPGEAGASVKTTEAPEGADKPWATILPLASANALATFAFVAMEVTFAYFGQIRFGLDTSRFGLVLAFVGVVMVVVQGGLVGRLSAARGDQAVSRLGLALLAGGLLAMPLAGSLAGAMAFLAMLAVGQGLTRPTLASLSSASAPRGQEGWVLGIHQSFAAGARAAGPIAAGWLYDRSDALPYYVAGALALIAVGAVRRPRSAEPAPAPAR